MAAGITRLCCRTRTVAPMAVVDVVDHLPHRLVARGCDPRGVRPAARGGRAASDHGGHGLCGGDRGGPSAAVCGGGSLARSRAPSPRSGSNLMHYRHRRVYALRSCHRSVTRRSAGPTPPRARPGAGDSRRGPRAKIRGRAGASPTQGRVGDGRQPRAAGRVPSVTSSLMVEPSRRTLRVTVSPGA